MRPHHVITRSFRSTAARPGLPTGSLGRAPAATRIHAGPDWNPTLRYLVIFTVVAVLAAGCASTSPTPEPQPERSASYQRPAPDAEARHCMALTMYWEARGEGREGMLAVGWVVVNRVDDPRFPDTVCGVVHQGGETPPCQFSWWCDGHSDRPTASGPWQQALALADELLTARPADRTGAALFFHSASMTSPWQRTRTARIGNHVFYR